VAARLTSFEKPACDAGWYFPLIIIVASSTQAGEDLNHGAQAEPPCSGAWYRSIEEKVATGDAQGYGPDIGTGEWKPVIEFRPGIRGQADMPGRDSEDWCRYIDQVISASPASPHGAGGAGKAAGTRGSSCDCNKTEPGSIAALVCENKALSALDLKLAGVCAAAPGSAGSEHPPFLEAEQRGWIKGRDDCWKNQARRGCVRGGYLRRIIESTAGELAWYDSDFKVPVLMDGDLRVRDSLSLLE
jgi:hypothetical protein